MADGAARGARPCQTSTHFHGVQAVEPKFVLKVRRRSHLRGVDLLKVLEHVNYALRDELLVEECLLRGETGGGGG